jgi:preprotein translocase subunit SecD
MYGITKVAQTSIVLIAFLAVLFALMKLSDYALSLSGIAAIILSIGMAVDANILMYERLREELKEGKSIGSAIDTAKSRSRTAIRDGQLSTGLIALILFTMGTNMFK